MAADLATLERALVNADAAGDTEAATILAGEIKKARADGFKDAAKSPQRGAGTEIARQVGLTVRAGVGGALAPFAMVGDALGADSSGAVQRGLTMLGLPQPETGTERVAQDIAGGLAGMGGVARIAQAATPTSGVGQAVQQLLTQRLGLQAGGTAAATGAAGVTREAGGGPGSQLVAGLTAGVAAPMAAQAVAQAPRNLLAASVRRSEARPFAVEGNRLATETGIDLPLGARTGNKMVLGMENAARQYGPTADRVQDIDVKIANQAIGRVNALADRISKTSRGADELGTAIESTVKQAAVKLDTLRDAAASRDYGRVREIAGDQPVIKLDGFAGELRKIIDDFSNVAGADAQKVVAQARQALGRITGTLEEGTPARTLETPTGRPIKLSGTPSVKGTLENTISEAMRTRSFYGKAARGGANVFEDISPNLNRDLAARLFGAVNRDFDNAALNADGKLKQALDTANANYRKFSQSIEYLEKSTLGKLVGDDVADAALSGVKASTTAGETVIKKVMSAEPSSRKAAMEILTRWNPDLAKETRAFVLRDALEKAGSIPPSQKGASEVPISFNRFISAIQGEKSSFTRQLESYGYTKQEISDIRDTVAAMMRAGDKTGFNFSNTNVQGEAMEIAGAVGSGLMGNVKGAATKMISIGGKMFGLRKIADAMSSAEGRQALRTLSSPTAQPQAVLAAVETIDR